MKFNPNYHITAYLTKQLLEIERHKEAITILPVTANLIASLRETARLQSTHYSTQIEGNALTQAEVQKVVKDNKSGFPGRERDEREVKNYFRALEYLEDKLKLDIEISKKLIQSIHGLVWKGFKKGTPYRDGQNVIRNGATGDIVYMPPEAKDVSILMNNLIDWTHKMMSENEIPAPIVAGLFHYQFATIHPYYDGNGRTARLLTTFILHKMGYGMKGMYSLEEYYAKNLQGYYKALTIGNSHNYYGGRAQADITHFLDYFLEGMAISFRSVRQKAQRLKELNQDRPIPFQTEKLRELRPHQKQTLSLFIKNKEVSIQEIATHLGLKNRSTYALVKKWIDDGFIQIENESRKSRTYVLTKQWELLISKDISQELDR